MGEVRLEERRAALSCQDPSRALVEVKRLPFLGDSTSVGEPVTFVTTGWLPCMVLRQGLEQKLSAAYYVVAPSLSNVQTAMPCARKTFLLRNIATDLFS